MTGPRSRYSTRCVAALLLALAWPLLTAADINHLRLPMNSTGGIQIDSPTPLAPGSWSLGSGLTYAYNPLVWRYTDNSYDPVIAHQLGMELTGNVGIVPLLDAALRVPLILRQGGGEPGTLGNVSGTGLGDLRVAGRFNVMPQRIFGLGLSAVLDVSLPTGDGRLLAGQGAVGVEPALVAALPVGSVTVRARLAYTWAKRFSLADVSAGDTLALDVGAGVPLWLLGAPVVAMAELHGATGVRAFGEAGVSGVEALAGLRGRLAPAWDWTLAAGMGLGHGLGVAAARLWVGAAYRPHETDTDGDGVPDAADACPNEAETYNGFADLDGCPDAREAGQLAPQRPVEPPPSVVDHDHDGIPDVADRCPALPETINGIDDNDGCPDSGEGATQFRPQMGIELKRTILFETGRAVIKPESFPVLDQVALQLLAHTEVLRVRVEGHTDSVGSAATNLRLSQGRAEAVRNYLIERGIAAQRLVAEGFGASQPLQSNDTADGRASNRRVAFIILQTGPAP